MVTVKDASIYSMEGAMVYELTYSTGYKVRTIVAPDKFIRYETNNNGAWVAACKPYVVAKNKKRNAERVRDEVINFLK